MPRPKNPNAKTHNQRQAEYQARLRTRTPLQRQTGLAEEDLYTPEERALLGLARKAEADLLRHLETLGVMVRSRLRKEATEAAGDPELILAIGQRLAALDGQVKRITLPNH